MQYFPVSSGHSKNLHLARPVMQAQPSPVPLFTYSGWAAIMALSVYEKTKIVNHSQNDIGPLATGQSWQTCLLVWP